MQYPYLIVFRVIQSYMTRHKKTITVTVSPELAMWLDRMVERRTFANRSHGIELCILEGQKKYPK